MTPPHIHLIATDPIHAHIGHVIPKTSDPIYQLPNGRAITIVSTALHLVVVQVLTHLAVG